MRSFDERVLQRLVLGVIGDTHAADPMDRRRRRRAVEGAAVVVDRRRVEAAETPAIERHPTRYLCLMMTKRAGNQQVAMLADLAPDSGDEAADVREVRRRMSSNMTEVR